jgi:2,3-bisphosphoglycerate-dependent phosphoglycerate mutase
MNHLVLLRHGQSFWNKERRFTGWADIDLTVEGKQEAKQSGKLIKELNIEFDACFTSELKRAINTLQIVLDFLKKSNIPITKTNLLNERMYGNLTGLNKDDVMKKYGKKQVKIWRRSFDISPPKINDNNPYKKKINTKILSESLKDTFERVVPFYQKKVEPLIKSKKNILMVFHGNSIRALLMELFNISKKNIVNFEIPTGNPLLIRFTQNNQIKDYKYLDRKRAKKILFNI